MVILDPGHGINTIGKRSPIWPDGTQLQEFEFNRDICRRVKSYLDHLKIPCIILVHEIEDVSLPERVRRANDIYKQFPDAFVVSVHANAGGGTGWEIFTSKGHTESDKIATQFYEVAKTTFVQRRMRVDFQDGDPDKEAQFYILRHTKCPAILTENFFMDNQKDCKYIMSELGRQEISNMHVNSIVKYINNRL